MPDFLAMLAEEEERALRARGITRQFRRGAIMLREGEEATRVLVLTEGRTKAVTFTEDGKEVILGVMGPGSLLGEVATIQNRPRSATVTALEPCTAIALAARDFWGLLEEYPRIWIAVHEVVIGRLRLADLQRKEFSGSNTLSRVSRRLVELTNEHGREDGDGVTITLPLTQEELAGWTGASREAVAKSLRTLRDLGWIETGRRSISVRDSDALRRFAR
ncbi:Crp/Fnr family transcriptional regulator [Solirubrobacter soli]|uniref:Crp/Fnr family transcriptional regulator n=1 Tax=Solirubrobacter soli TaxID=363832 RepID=UPI000420333E|nr:Crp/Fnr family transcriptional regulator [Solirubrobacter soli]